jgi:hypothetical protein
LKELVSGTDPELLRSYIPFLGHGVYGDGSLSTKAIIRELGAVEDASLASVAE